MKPIPCRCAAFRTIDVDDFHMESPVCRFEELAQRPPPHWWLTLTRCRDCGQYWLLAQEVRLNDIYVIKRLDEIETLAASDGQWPTIFDNYEDLIRIGKENGHAAAYFDPMETLPICIDLVGQRPSITPEAIAQILNIDLDDAKDLYSMASTEISKSGYPYPWAAA